MLTTTLRSLQRDGLVDREEFDEMPRRVVDELTPLGFRLGEPITAIVLWAQAHRDEVVRERAAFDADV